MANFWKVVNNVIAKADILMIVLDARMYKESINPEIEDKIRRAGKKYLYVINKVDLLTKEEQKDIEKIRYSIQVSAKEFLSVTRLLKKLLAFSKGEKISVGVLGYPNTGKSSIINALRGKHSAPSSSTSGYTKGIQFIRIHPKILLLDTPGVFPYGEKNDTKHALIGAKDLNRIKDPELVAMEIIAHAKGKIEKYYDVEVSDDFDETLENIAKKKNMMISGGKPDTKRMAKAIIKKWQEGGF